MTTISDPDRKTQVPRLLKRASALHFDEHDKALALVRDTRVVIRTLFGEASPHLQVLDSISFRPTDGIIYNTGHYKNTAAWNDGVKCLKDVLKAMQLECRLSTAPSSSELIPPEKVTLPWLFKHVSWKHWLSLGTLLIAVFALGAKFGHTPLIEQLLGITPTVSQSDRKYSQPQPTVDTSTVLPDHPVSQPKPTADTPVVLFPPTWVSPIMGATSPDGRAYLAIDNIALDNRGTPWLVNVRLTTQTPDKKEVEWSGALWLTRRQVAQVGGTRYSLSVLQCETNRAQIAVYILP